MVVDGSAKRGIWRLWRVCARCVMSLMVSLCFNWKVRRSWRASMPGMTVSVMAGLVGVVLGFQVTWPAVPTGRATLRPVSGFFLRFVFLWPRRNC